MPCRNLIGAIALVPLRGHRARCALEEAKYPDCPASGRSRPMHRSVPAIRGIRPSPSAAARRLRLTPNTRRSSRAVSPDRNRARKARTQGTPAALRMPRVMTVVGPIVRHPRPHSPTSISRHMRVASTPTDAPGPRTRSEPRRLSIGKWIDEDGDGAMTCSRWRPATSRGPRQYESSGLPLHADNQTVVKERFFLDKTNKDVFHDEITTIDHALTRP